LDWQAEDRSKCDDMKDDVIVILNNIFKDIPHISMNIEQKIFENRQPLACLTASLDGGFKNLHL